MHRLGSILLSSAALVLVAVPERTASAAELPAIKLSESNPVPECATPGRLMSYVRSRNEKLDAKFDNVAVEYMRHGEDLGIRWDYAFYQMLLETDTLRYTGDVKISQNNFAGLGATGRGARGESFKTVSDGVRAHLQHLLMYAGEKIENPVAERTKNIQEWGVLTKWQATISGPMTFAQLAKQWAPTSRGYPKDIETLAGLFQNGACRGEDPNPELVQEARSGRAVQTNGKVAAAGKGAQIAKQAIADARADGAPKSGLGAENVAKSTHDASDGSVAAGPPVNIINSPAAEIPVADAADLAAETPAKAEPAKTEKSKAPAAKPADEAKAPSKEAKQKPAVSAKESAKPAAETSAPVQTAALNAPLLGDAKAPAISDAKCRVFTASYGGTKSVIIKADAEGIANYTVLDVNDGAEKREADAYISAYAKGGEMVGDAQTQDKALEKAFELCPEG